MTPTDLKSLLAPCSPSAPAGDDLAYRHDFIELMQLAAGVPDVEYGAMRVAAVEPPWAEIEIRTSRLMQESRDLRLAVLFTRARAIRHGLAGLADGLALIDALLGIDWLALHPRLDPDDAFDPTERINILAELATPAQCLRLAETPVIELSRLGELPLAAFQSGACDTSGNQLAIALSVADTTAVTHSTALLADCISHAANIEHQVNKHLVPGRGLSLAPLSAMLQAALDLLGPSPAAPPATDQQARPDGALASRGEIAQQLEHICDYFHRHEPSSPIPLLLRRAIRLLEMDFLAVMAELAPGALHDIRALSGPSDE